MTEASESKRGPRILERHSSVLGLALLRMACECGFVTDVHAAIACQGGDDPCTLEMRGHLLDEHPEHDWPFGRCDRCGKPTDAFRALVPELGTYAWLCDTHAPKLPVVVDQAGGGA